MKLPYKVLLWIGVVTILIPFLGIPQMWKDFALFVIGIILVSFSLFVRHQKKSNDRGDTEDVFVESDVEYELEETDDTRVAPEEDDDFDEEEIEDDVDEDSDGESYEEDDDFDDEKEVKER